MKIENQEVLDAETKERKVKFKLGKKSAKKDKKPKELDISKVKKEKKQKPLKKMNVLQKIMFNSIAKKLLIVFGATMLAMLIMMVVFIIKVVGYNNQYQEILQNVYKINYIKTESVSQANRLMSLCMSQKSIEESGETEVVETMLSYLDAISANIGDDVDFAGNQGMVNAVRTPLTEYKGYFDHIIEEGTDGNFPSLDGDVSETIQQMFGMNTTMSTYCSSLIGLELERSSVIQDRIAANFQRMILIVVVIFFLVLIGSTTFCIVVIRGITGHVSALKKEISIVADGDLSRDNIAIRSNDEIKDLGDAFNNMSDSLRDIIGKVVHVTEEIDNSTKVVSASVAENSKGSAGVAQSVDEMSMLMSKQNEESDNTLKQVYEMEEISEKITEGVNRISENANVSLERAEKGSENIEQYVKQLSHVNSIMNQMSGVAENLTNSTKEMNAILESITEISTQTSLLSLNASIEAARAGEAGRGFAVVATEIRKLADDTQSATNKIGNIINNVQFDVEDMTSKMQDGLSQLEKSNEMADVTKANFADIKEGTTVVNDDVSNIVERMEKMSQVVNAVMDSMKNITESIEKNTATTFDIAATVSEETANLEEVATSANGLADLAGDLHHAISKFKIN